VQKMELASDESLLRRRFTIDYNYGTGDPRFIVMRRPTVAGTGLSTQEFRVYPVPNALGPETDGAYTIAIPYWGFAIWPPLRDTPATTDWFVENAEEYIVWKAAGEAHLLNWDQGNAAVALQVAAEKAKEVIRLDKELRASTASEEMGYSLGADDDEYWGE
jgi:hypothetical protein